MNSPRSDYLKLLDLITCGPGSVRFHAGQERGYIELAQQALAWTASPSIQAFGFAPRTVGGKKTRDLALKVYITGEKTDNALSNHIPPFLRLPDSGEPLYLDVEQQEKAVVHTGLAGPGDGISRARGEKGTLGCIVQRKGDPSSKYVLSNAHVLAWSGTSTPAIGDDIVFPSATEGGVKSLAMLDRWSRLQSGPSFPNFIDAAIARVVDESILGINQFAGTTSRVTNGMVVALNGSNSKNAQGRVKDSFYRIRLTYRIPGRRTQEYGFNFQVLVEPSQASGNFSQGGDSGAIVVNSRNKVVGLHFAGSGSLGIFNRINHVFDQLDIELVPSEEDAVASASFAAPLVIQSETIDVLGRTLWGEARGESDEGVEAVASVMVNRTNFSPPKWWGATIEAVCRKPFQFSCWNHDDPNREKLLNLNEGDTRFRECKDIAKRVLQGQVEDRTRGATHYHTLNIKPNWAEGKNPSARIGGHIFYKEID